MDKQTAISTARVRSVQNEVSVKFGLSHLPCFQNLEARLLAFPLTSGAAGGGIVGGTVGGIVGGCCACGACGAASSSIQLPP